MSSSDQIRSMTADDLVSALALTQAEKWPHREGDWSLHFALGEGWVKELDGRVVGTAMRWRYGEHSEIETVGLIVVDQSMQGKGIGRTLVQKLIDASDAAEMRLVATKAGLKLYQQNQFKELGGIRQCQGKVISKEVAQLPADTVCRVASHNDIDVMVELDAEAFGCSRESLIRAICEIGDSMVLERNGRICSFAVIRNGGHGRQFGPVVAETDHDAQYLIAALLPENGDFTRIDITDRAIKLLPWLESVGMAKVDEVVAMSRINGEPKSRAQETIRTVFTYALVSQAFG